MATQKSIDDIVKVNLYFTDDGLLELDKGAGSCLFVVGEPDGLADDTPIEFDSFEAFEAFHGQYLTGQDDVLKAAECYFGQQPSPSLLVLGFANTVRLGTEGVIETLERIASQHDAWETFSLFVDIAEPAPPSTLTTESGDALITEDNKTLAA